MYLVSLYFDEISEKKIQKFINKTAKKSGNNFMIENKVPPHITIASFQTVEEYKAIEMLDKYIKNIKVGPITWASIGVFKSSVIFLSPILNEYIHNLSIKINEAVSVLHNVYISEYYEPFQWLPHTTIAKHMTREELILAFQELEKNFNIFSGKIVRIGLSRTNPYQEVIMWNLK